MDQRFTSVNGTNGRDDFRGIRVFEEIARVPLKASERRHENICPIFLLILGQNCPILKTMKGKQFIDKVFEIGHARGIPVRLDAKRGKGSHVTLYYGTRKTIVKDRRKEIPPGLLSAMLHQLGLHRDDVR